MNIEVSKTDDALRLKALIESAIDGIITIDDKGIIETINPAAAQLFLYAPEEVIGKNIKTLMPNPYRAEHDGYIQNYKRSRNPKIIGIGREVTGQKKDGKTFPMRLAVSEVILKDRTIFTGFVHDLSKQKAAESALKREKETAQTYLDIANTIIVVLDTNGDIALLNKKGADLLECEVSEAIGKNWFDFFIPPHELEKVKQIFKQMVFDEVEVDYYENEVITMGSKHRLMAWRNSIYYDGKGEVLGTISSGIDITEQRASEKKIQQLNEELEGKVFERTQELADTVSKLLKTNDQLAHEIQQKNATAEALRISELELKNTLAKEKELGELKSRFISMASHEFRTPLSSILTSAELIQTYNKGENPKINRNTNRILNSLKNLTEILNEFLSLSKLEEGKVSTEVREIEIWPFIEDVIEEIQSIKKKEQYITLVGKEQAISIKTDPKILRNICLNLLSNAIKYSDAGKEIILKAQYNKQLLTVHITDHGIGIPAEDQKHLFTRFYRATNAESIQGTGLGLSIVKRYLDLLNGSISFKSEVGKGTTFSFSIPTFQTSRHET